MNVLLPTLGSAGDVHPFISLGLALVARGHRATVFTSPLFRERIEDLGLGFEPVGTREEAEAIFADPGLWQPVGGLKVVARRVIVPSMARVHELITAHAAPDTVVAASSLAFGARIAQEKLGIPTATVHLQPGVMRSLVDHGMAGNIRISAAQPMWLKKAFFRLVDGVLVDRILAGPVNRFRAVHGLPPVSRVFHRWMHSPQLVLGMFPDWFAPLQPDWPAHTHLVGFPLWDGGGGMTIPAEAERFLSAGPPPVVFTAGSAVATLPCFFRESVEAAQRAGVRAMLVTNFPDQIPRELPRSVASFGYLPFSKVLPRAAAFVHHGGIGTLAQAIKAGVAHLVVPNAHDQFDNGWRIEQLGLGRCLPQSRYRSERVAELLRAIEEDGRMKARCREYASRVDAVAAINRACDLLEELGAKGRARG